MRLEDKIRAEVSQRVYKLNNDLRNKMIEKVREYQSVARQTDVFSTQHLNSKFLDATYDLSDIIEDTRGAMLKELEAIKGKYSPTEEQPKLSDIERLTNVNIYTSLLANGITKDKAKFREVYKKYRLDPDFQLLIAPFKDDMQTQIDIAETEIQEATGEKLLDTIFGDIEKKINSCFGMVNGVYKRFTLLDEQGNVAYTCGNVGDMLGTVTSLEFSLPEVKVEVE